jgi:serine protease
MFAVGLPMAAVGATDATPMETDSDDDEEYVVGFHDQLPEDRETYQGEPVIDVSERLTFFVVAPDNPSTFEIKVKTDDDVRYMHENRYDYELAATPDDGQYSNQYGPQITNTESAWDTTFGSTSVQLGLLDSGITVDHEDFVNSRVSGYDYVNGDSTPEDHNGCNYHGSHTAGTAAATTNNGVGIAGMSESSIIMHKIFDSGFMGCGSASTSQIAEALKDLGDKGAHISSNSWGGGSDQALLDAIDYANDKGVIHVAAAGNDGSCTNCISDPWASRPAKVVIVTCSDSNDDFCSFSSQGPEADIIGPGNNVLSVDGGTTSGYHELSGTSMSTPHVAGAVGLYIDANGDVSHSTMESELGSSADDLGMIAERQGDGRLNTGALVGGGGGGGSNSGPTADFTYTCTDLTCDFDGSSSSDDDGNITSYDWEFGDGTTGTGETTSHTYDSGGDYDVTLTVTDDDGATDSQTQTVSVSSSDSGASGMHVGDLDDSSSGGQGGSWTAVVDVLVHDSNHTAVGDATVSFDYTTDKGATGTASCTTASDGWCSVSESFRNRESPVDFTVTDVSHADLTYSSSDNHDPDGDSDGTTITVSK